MLLLEVDAHIVAYRSERSRRANQRDQHGCEAGAAWTHSTLPNT